MHETRQRNAELALINSVQTAIAGELEPQRIFDLVGDKIEEVYDAHAVSISTYDAATGLLSFLETPDFETPADWDGDNVYEVTVSASDGSLVDLQQLSVTVGDVFDEGGNSDYIGPPPLGDYSGPAPIAESYFF